MKLIPYIKANMKTFTAERRGGFYKYVKDNKCFSEALHKLASG